MFELLDTPDATVMTLKAKLGIDTADLRISGLSLLDFIAMVFGLVALAQSMTPETLVNSPRAAAFNKDALLANVKMTPSKLETFLAGKCTSFTDLQNRLTEGHPGHQISTNLNEAIISSGQTFCLSANAHSWPSMKKSSSYAFAVSH